MSNSILRHLCYDSDDDDSPRRCKSGNTRNTADNTEKDFVPFRKEISFCFKDQCVSHANDPANDDPAMKKLGFTSCLSKLENEESAAIDSANDDSGGNEITVSELLNCCRQADKLLTRTPDKGLHLVNSILEDFALSPFTQKTGEVKQFWEYSPEFILKSKPRITYSSRRRQKQRSECNKRLDFNARRDDCSSDSDCSFISIEENRTQLGEICKTTVIADTTETFCENLLNLSAYFTQTCPLGDKKQATDELYETKCLDPTEEKTFWERCDSVLRLSQEIASLNATGKQILRTCDSRCSNESFNGFPESINDPDLERRCVHAGSEDKKIEKCLEIKKGDKIEELDEWDKDYSDIFALVKTPPQNSQKRTHRKALDREKARLKTLNSCFITTLNEEEAKSKGEEIFDISPIMQPKQIEKSNIEILGENINTNHSGTSCCVSSYSGINQLPDKPSTSKAALQANREFVKRKISDDLQPLHDQSTHRPFKKIRGMTANNITGQKTVEAPSSPIEASVGFQTASGRNIKATSKALKSVSSLLKEFQSDIEQFDETGVESFKNQINAKQGKLQGPIKASVGFQTANGRNIKPTSKALKSVSSLLKEFQSDIEQFDETGVESFKNQINVKQGKLQASTTKILNNHDGYKLPAEDDLANVILSEWPLEDEPKHHASPCMPASSSNAKSYQADAVVEQKILQRNPLDSNVKGFCTAGGKSVLISDRAKKAAESLLKPLKDDLETCDLLNIKNGILKKNQKIMTENQQNENSMKTNEEHFHTPKAYRSKANNSVETPLCKQLNSNVKGFCTAGGKNVLISDRAKKAADSLLQTLEDDFDTCDLLNIKNDMLKKNQKIVTEQQKNEISVKANEEHFHTPKAYQSKTNNSLSELSVESPLCESVANSIINRKNVLSLSKKRRKSIITPARKAISEIPIGSASSADRMQSLSRTNTQTLQSPSTPNANGLYFSASVSSTPRSAQCFKGPRQMDEDFKPIPWHDNKSISEMHCNIAVGSPKPSVEDRLGRLRMYGEPPPLSPILTNFQNKCRSSGLRPKRSMLKREENK